MSKRPSSKASRTDWRRVNAVSDRDIVLTDEHPEMDPRHVVRVILRRGLKPPPPKTAISLRIDEDVLAWFKAQGQGYQTRINAVLYAYMRESMTLDQEARVERGRRKQR